MLFGGDTTETCLCNTEAYIHQWQHLWHYLHGQTPLEVSGKISLSPVRANFSSHSGCMQKMQPFCRLSGFILTTIFHLITVTHHASPPCWQLPWQPTRCLCCSLRKKPCGETSLTAEMFTLIMGPKLAFTADFFRVWRLRTWASYTGAFGIVWYMIDFYDFGLETSSQSVKLVSWI